MVGRGPRRVMIEAGDYPERNTLFLENFRKFLEDFKHVSIDRIFITHAHYDHFGGVTDVLSLLREQRAAEADPTIYKKLDGNHFEKEVFERYPKLKD